MENAPTNPVASQADQGSQEFATHLTDAAASRTATSPVATPPPGTPPAGSSTVTPPPAQTLAGPSTVTPPAGQTPAAPAPMSQADIIKATADGVAQAMQSRQPGPATPQVPAGPKAVADLNPQEFAERFGVTRASDALITQIQGADPKAAAAALDTYGQNLVRQAVLMALEVAEARTNKLRGDFEPHVNSWKDYDTKRREKEVEESFFTAYPDLKGERELVMEMKDAFIAKVRAGQLTFKTHEESFSAVAGAVRKILGRVSAAGTGQPQNGAGTNGNAGTPSTPPPAAPGRQMSAASTAGRSGSGQPAVKNHVDTVFGADAR